MRRPFIGISVLTALICLVAPSVTAQGDQSFDIVLVGGRVIDPESGLDAVRNVGILDGRIAAISAQPLAGRTTVRVAGLVVAPGFIDLHAHGQDSISSRFQAHDGVTTALELEGGAGNVSRFYAVREGRAIVNYGATASHGSARYRVLTETTSAGPAAVYSAATDDEMRQMGELIRQGLDEGGLGIGFGIQYVPGARREEILTMFRIAAEYDVTNFVHNRGFGRIEPGGTVEAVQELIADAAITGASVHMVHVGSSSLGEVPLVLNMIEGAQQRGLDISTEVYPYTAGSTDIRAALFDPGWRERTGGDYGDIEWVATGERLTEATFHQFREEGGPIIVHIIPQDMVDYAVAHPIVMIASDGVPYIGGRAHPRGAGTYARVLGRYVREQGTIPLMEALRKMSLLPARRLERAVPQMHNKGRIRVGADADLAVFDPDRVIDRATYADPAQYSEGIVHFLVNGTFVVRDERLLDGVFPGIGIRRPVAPIQ
jgi:dihydroorotase